MPFVFSLLVVAAMVFAVVDIVMRDDGQIKHMPKVVWLILVILLPLIGTVLWFTIGRDYPERPARAPRAARHAPAPPAPPPPRDTRTTEQQLADLEREIEEERLRAELRRRRGDAQAPGSAEPSAGSSAE
jgi:hypothetical protein